MTAMPDLLANAFDQIQAEVDGAFDAFLPVPQDTRARLVEAMRYAAIGGGKRVRPLLLVATLAMTALGFWSIGNELAGRLGEDPQEIVIDEVAGQWIALLVPSFGFWHAGLDSWNFPYPGWVAAFVFFRLFDIWKPWIIGRADARGDAAGVMLDDLLAGVFAAVAVMITAGIAHGFLM